MIRWLRVVLPPWWAVGIAAAFSLAFPMIFVVLEWRIGGPIEFLKYDDLNKVVFFGPGAVSCLYAGYRVWAFHPALKLDYLRWLRNTPWTSTKPLLLGPVHLVWQDALILALLVGICWPRASWNSLTVMQAFLFVYFLVLGYVLALTEAKWWAFAVGVGIGLMALFALDRWIFFAAAAATYAAAYLGLRKSLTHFPWENSPLTQAPDSLPKTLGWPYDQLGPLPPERWPITVQDALLSGTVAAWWFFVANEHFLRVEGEQNGTQIAFLLVLGAGMIGRVVIYCACYWEPISFDGRLSNGYFLIPGYDRVLIAPLVAMLFGVATIFAHQYSPFDSCIVPAFGFALAWWVLLGMGPSIREWRLTGHHRIIAMQLPETAKKR